MALAKLTAITARLLAADLAAPEQIDSWMEDGRLETRSKSLGNGGVRVCRMEYDAVIRIERYSKPPALIFALITTWLMEHDDERHRLDLPDPQVEVDVIDDDRADVEITIRFSEEVDLVQDDSGQIPYLGNTYSVSPVPIDEPNEVAVGDNKDLPTDAPYAREN